MADKFEPNNNILSFSEYMKELQEQKKSQELWIIQQYGLWVCC